MSKLATCLAMLASMSSKTMFRKGIAYSGLFLKEITMATYKCSRPWLEDHNHEYKFVFP